LERAGYNDQSPIFGRAPASASSVPLKYKLEPTLDKMLELSI